MPGTEPIIPRALILYGVEQQASLGLVLVRLRPGGGSHLTGIQATSQRW